MAMSRHLPLLVLFLLADAALAAAALGGGGGYGPMVGGWNPIPDVSNDAHIQKLGGWALGQAQQRKLASTALGFRRVVRGEQQVVSGMNYRLYLEAAANGRRPASYVAVVYEQVWTNTLNLTSFKPAPRAH